jgi:hypothetical protein
VHLLGRADDGIDRAGLDAERAADAGRLVDDRHLLGFFDPVLGRQRLELLAQQVGQLAHAFVAARRALVDFGCPVGDCLRVGLATGKAALAALCLRQHRVDLVDQRVALDLELDRGVTQCGAEYDGTERHDGNRDQNAHW